MKEIKIIYLIVFIFFLPFLLFSEETVEDSTWYYRDKDPSLEIISARTLNTKVFLNEDGHCTYRIYLQPVHYIDKTGHLCDIELSCGPEVRSSAMDFSGYADDLFGDLVTNDEIWTHEDGFWRGFAKFNTSAIPDETIIDSVKLSLYALNCWGVVFGGTHDIRSMESNPQTGNGYTVYADAGNGYLYVDDFDPDPDILYTWILGDEPTDYACQQMTNLLPEDWFAIGMCDYGGGGWYSNAMGYDGGIGYVEIEQPTAVALVSFTASPDFDFVQLNWRTEFEIDNLQWLIERKNGEGKYKIIATIAGNNTKPSPTNYSYIDRDVFQGESYFYRLTDISNYGYKSVHSPVLVKIPEVKRDRLLVFPSLFRNCLSIKVRGFKGKRGRLNILDETGRIVKAYDLTGEYSPLSLIWNGKCQSDGRVTNGVYFIRLAIDGSLSETKKVILLQ